MEICDECERECTKWICCCLPSPKRICEICYPSHKSKTEGTHHLYSTDYRGYDDLRKRLGFAQRKLQDLNNAGNVAKTHLQTADRSIEDVNNSVAMLIEEITRMRDEAVERIRSNINQMQTALVSGLERAKNNAMEPTYVPSDPLERKLWSYHIESDCSLLELVEFNYAEQFNRIRESLVLDHSPVPVSTYKVPVFDNLELRLFETSNESWSQSITLSQSLPLVGRFNAFLPNSSLFHCGGSDGSNATPNCFEINTTTGAVTSVAPMRTARYNHGGIRCDPFVFVFGGKIRDQMLCSGEKFHMEEKKWDTLPNMKSPRMSFNPLLFDNLIYLCGGLIAACEVFNPSINEYTALSFTLAEKSPTLTVAKSSEELVIITSLNRHHWNNTMRALEVNIATNIGPFISNEMVPVLVNGLIYLPGWRGVKVLNISNWEITDRRFP